MAENEVCVIVLSYNRPRMLGEALRSIRKADQVILIDDGSDFDAAALLKDVKPDARECLLIQNPKLTHAERISVPHVGRGINEAIRKSSCGIISYLCDDDLFHEGWPEALRDFFSKNQAHVAFGGWNRFRDGEVPGDEPCPLGNILTTGNFAHRRSCSIEHGLWWGEHTVTVHDSYFVNHVIFRLHPEYARIRALAGWRREHQYNMFNYTGGLADQYSPHGVEVLRREKLED